MTIGLFLSAWDKGECVVPLTTSDARRCQIPARCLDRTTTDENVKNKEERGHKQQNTNKLLAKMKKTQHRDRAGILILLWFGPADPCSNQG